MKLKELKTLLLENQCKERIVRAGINKALKIPGSKLINLKPKEKKEDPTLCRHLQGLQGRIYRANISNSQRKNKHYKGPNDILLKKFPNNPIFLQFR